MTESETCRLALDTYGIVKQTLKMIEEMAELQKELCKNLWGSDNTDAIAEEIADVEIVLTQMKMYYKCAVRVDEYKAMKLERLRKRIAENGLQRLDNTGTENA